MMTAKPTTTVCKKIKKWLCNVIIHDDDDDHHINE